MPHYQFMSSYENVSQWKAIIISTELGRDINFKDKLSTQLEPVLIFL